MVRQHLLPYLLLAVVALPASTLADQPCVRFDVPPMVDAVDVSTPAFLTANPAEKLVRIRIPISSLVRLDSEGSLLQYLYLVNGPGSTPFQIVDYAPKTATATDIAGPIVEEQTEGESSNIGFKAFTPQDFPLKADATAGHSSNNSISRRLERLPPQELLAASGTLHRGSSAYFKLKPSTQTTLEGSKQFEVVARVPYSWRAGLVKITCAAFSKRRGGDDRNAVCGRSEFVVGIYMAGDEAAKQSVWRLAETQQQLRSLAMSHAQSIKDRRFPSLGHKIGAALSVVEPKIPDHWLDKVLSSQDYHAFERHLPRPIRSATTEYREARQQVNAFAG